MTADLSLSAALDLVDIPAVRAAVILVVGLVLVSVLARFVQRRVARRGSAHWALVSRKLVAYAGAATVFVAAARTLGLDLTALAATAGVATVAVGFAAQTSLSNLIAGLFLLVDRPFEIGDSINIDGNMGVVRGITLMSTLVRTFDGILIRWPNEVVLKSTILNYSSLPARRVEIRVGVAYGTDLPRARRVIREAISDLEIVLVEPTVDVITRGFLDSAVELEVRAWVAQGDFVQGRTAVVEAVHRSLADAGIEIPFPHRTIRLADGAKPRTIDVPATNPSSEVNRVPEGVQQAQKT
ncbi:MAG: mechanosensitive ion channel family protein [Deltaproteobacteria bacterium]|nr:MAG: mechanosensitive ion channel family protein [Deltaproteobacteria bacterium]